MEMRDLSEAALVYKCRRQAAALVKDCHGNRDMTFRVPHYMPNLGMGSGSLPSETCPITY
jgi:hypothetical protein